MRTRKSGCYIAAAAVVACGVAGGKWVIGERRLYADVAATLPAEIAAARRARIPVTAADLAPANPVPDASNAAPYYKQISITLLGSSDEQSIDAMLSGKAIQKDRTAVQRLLAANTAQIQLAEQAATLPGCDFHRDWGRVGQILAGISPMRSVTLLLAARAALESDADQPAAALHTIGVAERIAHHLDQEPVMNGPIVRAEMEEGLSHALVGIMKRYADTPSILALAEKTDSQFGDMPDLRHAFGAEVIMSLAEAATIRTASLSEMHGMSQLPICVSRDVLVDAFEARALSYWRRVFAAVDSAKGDTMAAYRALKAVDDADQARVGDMNGRATPTYELQNQLIDRFSGTVRNLVRMDALRRLRATLLALLRYRAVHRAFPASLASLSPPPPLDPYVGQPLKYRLTARGFLLYSVGQNLKDDGGDAVGVHRSEPLDIVIAYP